MYFYPLIPKANLLKAYEVLAISWLLVFLGRQQSFYLLIDVSETQAQMFHKPVFGGLTWRSC